MFVVRTKGRTSTTSPLIDNLDLATASTKIILLRFPALSRAYDTIDKRNIHSFSFSLPGTFRRKSFSALREIIFIIASTAPLFLAKFSFADSHGWSHELSKLTANSPDRIVSFPLLYRSRVLSRIGFRCLDFASKSFLRILISSLDSFAQRNARVYFPSPFYSRFAILYENYVSREIYYCPPPPSRGRENPQRDVIISRPKFHDNGWISDFRVSAVQKSLIKLSRSDRGRYLAIISLRGVLRPNLHFSMASSVETTLRANKNIVWRDPLSSPSRFYLFLPRNAK